MHESVAIAIGEAVATRNNGALFSLAFRRRLAVYDALLAAEDLTGPDRMAIQLLRAEAEQQAKVLNNYRMRMSSVIETIDPTAPPGPEEAELLRTDLLAQIEREHDARRAAAYTPEQEQQVYTDRIALVGRLFGIIDGAFNPPTQAEKQQMMDQWGDLNALDQLAAVAASKRAEVLALPIEDLAAYDVTAGWPT